VLCIAGFFASGGKVEFGAAAFVVAYAIGMALLPNRGKEFGDGIFLALIPTVAFLVLLSWALKAIVKPVRENGSVTFYHYSALKKWPILKIGSTINPISRGYGSWTRRVVFGWGRPVCRWANQIYGVPHELMIIGSAPSDRTAQAGLGFLTSEVPVEILSYMVLR
jgi:hypothetical protein